MQAVPSCILLGASFYICFWLFEHVFNLRDMQPSPVWEGYEYMKLSIYYPSKTLSGWVRARFWAALWWFGNNKKHHKNHPDLYILLCTNTYLFTYLWRTQVHEGVQILIPAFNLCCHGFHGLQLDKYSFQNTWFTWIWPTMHVDGCRIGPHTLNLGIGVKWCFLRCVKPEGGMEKKISLWTHKLSAQTSSVVSRTTYFVSSCRIPSMPTWVLVLEEAACPSCIWFYALGLYLLPSQKLPRCADMLPGELSNFFKCIFNDKVQIGRCRILHLSPWANHLNLLYLLLRSRVITLLSSWLFSASGHNSVLLFLCRMPSTTIIVM